MTGILTFIIVLGVLVFFHELGHFIAAKLCGVYCDRFSLGMPPRIFGIRIGETDYCLGALPIGGYVKMAGQQDMPSSEEEHAEEFAHVPPERWFSNKPVWQRAIILAAGPLMNIVLAVGLYGIVAAVGDEVPVTKFESRIGFVEKDSPASRAKLYPVDASGQFDYSGDPVAIGWQTGDRIESVNGNPVSSIADVAFAAALAGEGVVNVVLSRPDGAGGVSRFASPVTPAIVGNSEHPRFGVLAFDAAYVAEVLPDTPAAEAGIVPEDVIILANGKVVDKITFAEMVQEMSESEELTLTVERGGATREVTLKPRLIGRLDEVVFDPPLFSTDDETRSQRPVIAMAPKTADTDQEAPASARLLRYDEVLEVNGQPATVGLLGDTIENNAGNPLTLNVRRPAILWGLWRGESFETIELTPKAVGVVGVVWGSQTTFHRVPLLRVVPEALKESSRALARTVSVLVGLVTTNISPDNLGGPIMIARLTSEAASMGFSWLFELTAFISINLAVFNLLPLPVLDGGHLAFLAVEAVRKKPVSLRVALIVQQAGVFLLVGLILYVTFNDVTNWISSITP
jgi:regulator of sigma E protease